MKKHMSNCLRQDVQILAVRLLREELQLLQEPGSYVGEVLKVRGARRMKNCATNLLRNPCAYSAGVLTHLVRPVQVMGKNKVLVKVHPEGKYVVDLDKSIDIAQVIPLPL